MAGLTDVVATAVSEESSYVLLRNGTVVSWGKNDRGELGNGQLGGWVWTYSPLAPLPNLEHVKAIAAGDHHALALLDDGTVWAWGANDLGQLGNGSTTDNPLPEQAQQLSGIKEIASAGDHNLALNYAGNLYSWGSNGSGELGTGSGAPFEATPTQVPTLNPVLGFALGAAHCRAPRPGCGPGATIRMDS